jgi:cytochrome c oxidase assembly protein Cox11
MSARSESAVASTDLRSAEIRRNNRVLVTKLGVVVLAMFGFGYALVPFYE